MKVTLQQIALADSHEIQIDECGFGFDYQNQAWIQDGRYLRCGHPEDMPCQCYGRLYEGEILPELMKVEA